MTNTKSVKNRFGNKAYFHLTEDSCHSTQVSMGRNGGTIKMIQKEKDESIFSGYRKVNFADQKMQEVYRKLNRMLGGD